MDLLDQARWHGARFLLRTISQVRRREHIGLLCKRPCPKWYPPPQHSRATSTSVFSPPALTADTSAFYFLFFHLLSSDDSDDFLPLHEHKMRFPMERKLNHSILGVAPCRFLRARTRGAPSILFCGRSAALRTKVLRVFTHVHLERTCILFSDLRRITLCKVAGNACAWLAT